MDYAREIALYHNGPQHRIQNESKLLDLDKNRVNSSNFNVATLKFS